MNDRFDHTLEHTLDTKPDEAAGPAVEFRRIELLTGTGRRRKWSSDDKARIVFESALPGANVSAVARRNGLSPQQLFGWRREVRALIGEMAADTTCSAARMPSPKAGRPTPVACVVRPDAILDAPQFVRAVIAAPAASPPPADPSPSHTGQSDRVEGSTIEITVGDAVVRLSGPIDAGALAAVLNAVRRSS